MTNDAHKRHISILIPYLTKDGEVVVFLQKRSEDARALPGYFGFWGGGLEEGESFEEGLEREIREELGIDVTDYVRFGRYEFYGSIKEIFVAEVDDNFERRIVISEGDYGKFFSEDDVINEPKILDEDRVVLRNFFGLTKHDNPHQLYA